MLRGAKVVLRAVERDDVEVLAGWAQDYDTWPQVTDKPYVPKTVADTLRDMTTSPWEGRRVKITNDGSANPLAT